MLTHNKLECFVITSFLRHLGTNILSHFASPSATKKKKVFMTFTPDGLAGWRPRLAIEGLPEDAVYPGSRSAASAEFFRTGRPLRSTQEPHVRHFVGEGVDDVAEAHLYSTVVGQRRNWRPQRWARPGVAFMRVYLSFHWCWAKYLLTLRHFVEIQLV